MYMLHHVPQNVLSKIPFSVFFSKTTLLPIISHSLYTIRTYHSNVGQHANISNACTGGNLSQIAKAKNLTEAMKSFEELILSGVRPTEAVLSVMLHLCQVFNDKEKGNEVMKSVDKYALNPGQSLLVSKLNYYYWLRDFKETWQIYNQIIERDLPLRRATLLKLLELAMENRNHTHITDVLSNIKKCGFEMDHNISKSIFDFAISESVASPWQQLSYEVMNIYKDVGQLVDKDTANSMSKWITNQWGPLSTINSATIRKGFCSHCGNKMESNIISVLEHSQLLENARQSLVDQVKSFEVSYKEEEEYKRLMNLCTNAGSYGAVLDGLNVAGEDRETRRLVAVAEWAVKHTSQPVLVIAPVELASQFQPSKEISELARYYREKNIDLFFTQNRVADNHYTIYSSLASGPETYVVSNERRRAFLSIISPSIRPLYHKWWRSCRINFSNEPEETIVDSLVLPRRYDSKVQWTDTHYHIPLVKEEYNLWEEEEKWFCIAR